jgi:catecholate siderophore receptor
MEQLIVRARRSRSRRRTPLLPLGAMVYGLAMGSGVHAQSTAPQSTPEATLPTVNVRDTRDPRDTRATGYEPGVTSIGRMPQTQRDIPQSLTIVPETLILDRGADTLKDALRNVPGLTFNAGEGGRIGDNFTLRGYSVVGDLYLDGIRDVAQYNREVFNLDRVEVLRGSASMLFGRGSTGGVINQVSKEPYLFDRYIGTVSAGTHGYKRATTDLNKVVGEDAAVRLNAMWTDTDSYRDDVTYKRWGIAPAVRWGIGTRNELSLSYYRLEDDNIPDYGVPYFNGRPLDVPASRFYGMANADFTRNETGIATASWIHRFSPDTSFRTVVRKADYQRDLWAVAPRLPGGIGLVTDATTVNRQRQARGSDENTLTSQSDFISKFRTGAIGHQVLAGVELAREETERWSYLNTVPNPSTTVGNPNAFPALTPAFFAQQNARTGQNSFKGDTVGVYAQDMIELTPQWKVLAGTRWDRLSAEYFPIAGTSYTREDRVWSYRTGLIWQPSAVQSYYAAYGTSFNPSAELYSLDPRGVNTPPEKNRNYEVGAKWDLAGGDLFLRTAIFRTEKTNERNTDLSTPDLFLLSGKRHTDGIELEAAGRITQKWEMFGGLALMRANIDEASGQQANSQDKVPVNTPPYTANLWTTYRFAPEWRVGGGLEAVGRRYANAQNTIEVPSYVRWDGLLAYEQRRYAVRLNLYNLFNQRYWEGIYVGHVVPGTSRTALVSLELRYD